MKEAIPSDEQRYKHIVENMIHVGELQPKNMFLFLAAFDPKDEYEMNVYTGSFLDGAFDEHARDVWGVEKFDVIVQNPPYNDGSSNSGSAHVLWDKFVIKTLENTLIDNGYLVAVHPDGWRSLGKGFDKVKKCLKNRKMNYLEVQVSKKIFNALAVEASAGKYDGEAFFRGAAEYELTLVSEHIIRLVQEAFYSNRNLNYSTSASTDLGAFFDKNLTGRVNLDLRYSYLAPDSEFSGLRMNDLTLKGHVISTALYGKIDKAGRLNWFAAKDFLDIKRTQAGLIWNFKGGNKK